MNRHARRAAAAQARKDSDYQTRLLRALAHRTIPTTPGLSHVLVEHDAECSIFVGGGCNCDPWISHHDPVGRVTVIDRDGGGTRVAKQ